MRPGSGLLLYTDPVRDDDPDGETVKVPDLSGMTLRAGAEKLSELGVRMEVSGSGIIIRQEPAPGTQVQHGTIVHLYLSAP